MLQNKNRAFRFCQVQIKQILIMWSAWDAIARSRSRPRSWTRSDYPHFSDDLKVMSSLLQSKGDDLDTIERWQFMSRTINYDSEKSQERRPEWKENLGSWVRYTLFIFYWSSPLLRNKNQSLQEKPNELSYCEYHISWRPLFPLQRVFGSFFKFLYWNAALKK